MEEKNREEFTNYENNAEATPAPEKKKKKGFYLKVIALALCCSIFGGIIGAGITMIGGGKLQAKLAIGQGILSAIEDHDDFSITRRFGFNLSPFHSDRAKIDFYRGNGAYIGVAVTDSEKTNETPAGALIKEVEKGSPADKGGLLANDIVTMVNNVKIDSSDDLADTVRKSKSGDTLTLTVYRSGQTLDIQVTIGQQSI